jgi:hypothetical protein
MKCLKRAVSGEDISALNCDGASFNAKVFDVSSSQAWFGTCWVTAIALFRRFTFPAHHSLLNNRGQIIHVSMPVLRVETQAVKKVVVVSSPKFSPNNASRAVDYGSGASTAGAAIEVVVVARGGSLARTAS